MHRHVDGLQLDLGVWFTGQNGVRTHQARRSEGKTPLQTLSAGLVGVDHRNSDTTFTGQLDTNQVVSCPVHEKPGVLKGRWSVNPNRDCLAFEKVHFIVRLRRGNGYAVPFVQDIAVFVDLYLQLAL